MSSSRNAITARGGNRAEDALVKQPSVRNAFQVYFAPLTIESIVQITAHPKKKTDIRITFTDGRLVNIQNKDGNGTGRGWSIDRRSISKYTDNPALHTLLTNVCLRRGGDRPIITEEWLVRVLDSGLLGDEPDYMPDYFTHTKSDKTTGEILELSICSVETLITKLYDELYPEMEPKRTCVHLSPSISMQRKGGEKTDKKADDIQMKWRSTPSIAAIFTPLQLASPESTPVLPVQA